MSAGHGLQRVHRRRPDHSRRAGRQANPEGSECTAPTGIARPLVGTRNLGLEQSQVAEFFRLGGEFNGLFLALGQVPGDDHPLDLVGALEDLHHCGPWRSFCRSAAW